MRERGSGSLFRERYRDRTTGQLKVCRTWMMKLWVGGKPLKRSARTTSRAVASKQLEQWKAQNVRALTDLRLPLLKLLARHGA